MSLKKRLLSYLKAAPSMPWLTEVECLQNDYSQANNSVPYIDTEVKASWDLPFELVATVTKTSANRCLVLGNAPNQRTFYIELTATNRLRFSSQDSTGTDPTFVEFNIYTSSSYPIPLNVPTKIWVKYNPLNDAAHTIKYEMGLEALDGSVSTTQTGSVYRSGEPLSTRLNLRMFNDYRTPVSTFNGGFKIHQCEIKIGTVHKKFIPCLDMNRIPCMYEQIEGKLYYNSGTGGFNVGRRIVEVEYMNLTGLQRFNTGFKPNTLSTTLKTTFELTGSDSLSRFPFGCRKIAGYADSCSSYIAPVTSAAPYGYLRLDWAVQAGTPQYRFTSLTDKINLEITGNYANVNGTEYTSTVVTSFDHPATFYIGNCYTESASAFQSAFIGKYYFLELLNTYSRDDYRYCVPAHDENNVGFFFDRANHFIMDNEGQNTQDMTWGDEIHPVGFLYGGAPDRFNTGITFYDHKWETDARFNQTRTNINLMGVAAGACNYWGVLSNTAAALYGQYSLHTSNAEFGLNIDPTETRTVFLDSYRNNANTYDMLSMTVEGQSVTRSTSEANRTTGYRVPDFSTSYSEPAYLYGNRCYDRTTNKVLQNGIVAQNGQKQPILFDTITHSIIDTITSGTTIKLGADTLGYNTEPQLPYGFIEVDYLESTGTQYLNTGITPTNNMGIDVVYAYPTISSSTNAGLCGTYQGTSPRTDAFFISTNSGKTNSTILLAQGGQARNMGVTPTANTWYNAKINWLNDGLLYLDGTTYAVGTNTIESDKLVIFGRTLASDSSVALSNARIRRYRVSDGLRITHNYVPCLRIYDNKPGMFDLITRQFLTNQGTDEFIIGIDGVGYTPVEYLESTGTQWIDTGIQMQGKYGVEIEAKQTSASTGFGRYLFGDAPASTGRYLIVVTSGGNIFRLGLDTLNRDSNVSGYDGQFHTHKVENKTYFIDGVSQGTLNAPDFTCNRNARLFSVATTSTLQDNTWQIKRCVIKDENNNKLANFVPLVRVSDDKPGMFDLVSRTLCVNGADGADFTYPTNLTPNKVLVSSNSGKIDTSTVGSGKLAYLDGLTSNTEQTGNKTTTINNSSTDTEYPSAKAVYDLINN